MHTLTPRPTQAYGQRLSLGRASPVVGPYNTQHYKNALRSLGIQITPHPALVAMRAMAKESGITATAVANGMRITVAAAAGEAVAGDAAAAHAGAASVPERRAGTGAAAGASSSAWIPALGGPSSPVASHEPVQGDSAAAGAAGGGSEAGGSAAVSVETVRSNLRKLLQDKLVNVPCAHGEHTRSPHTGLRVHSFMPTGLICFCGCPLHLASTYAPASFASPALLCPLHSCR